MPDAAECMGLDIGTAKLSATVWQQDAKVVALLDHASIQNPVSGTISFRKSRTPDGTEMAPVFPVTTLEEGPDIVSFPEFKRALPLFGDDAAIRFLLKPVFEYWQPAFPAKKVHLTVSVPILYSWRVCQALREAAMDAGFASCSYINETLAAVIAAFPAWSADRARWKELKQSGCYVWVADSGSLDITLGLVYVYREESKLHLSYLAGDCLEECGALYTGPVANLQPKILRSLEKMQSARQAGATEAPVVQDRQSCNWVVVSGGAPHARQVAQFLKEALPGSDWADPAMDPHHAVSFGATLHQAIQQQKTPYSIGVIHRNLVIGVLAANQQASQLIPLGSPAGTFPFSCERAFQVPGSSRLPVEITLCAALPGGDIAGGLTSFVLSPETFSSPDPTPVLVRVAMQNWMQGSASVQDLRTGLKLSEGSFSLP
ncbi:MAG TPA: hypothetical protein VJW20_01945 [Candidatus Angelobacter sp.]|nr:hypothetical protein [Candidatus Angelobacter sp.]